jgi:O-antigen/teichoic acid export membrane protein
VKNFIECKFKIIKNKKLYVRLVSYSGWDLFGNFAVVCQGQGLNIVLNMFCGTAVNAARAVAYQIQGAISMFIQNFTLASRPQIIKSYAGNDKNEMYRLMFLSAKYSFYLMVLIIIPVYIELPTILNLWLKEVPNHTIVFTQIILISCVIHVYGSSSNHVYHAIGKIKLGNLLNGNLMITVLPISYFLLKMGYPSEYAFITLVVINSCVTVIGLFIIRSYVFFSLSQYFKKVLLPNLQVLVIGLVVPIMIYINYETSILRAILLFLCTDIWLLALIYSIGITKQERKKIKKEISARLKWKI